MKEFTIYFPAEKRGPIHTLLDPMFTEHYSWDMYEKVHVITNEAKNLDDVFKIAQNGNGYGWENLELRSLSVGDVVVDESGKAWFCDVTGWKSFDEIVKGQSLPEMN